jgi:glutaredoxin
LVAKEFLSSRGITFEERNIRADYEFIRELVRDYNSRSTPTLVAGGHVVMGFNPVEYEEALKHI